MSECAGALQEHGWGFQTCVRSAAWQVQGWMSDWEAQAARAHQVVGANGASSSSGEYRMSEDNPFLDVRLCRPHPITSCEEQAVGCFLARPLRTLWLHRFCRSGLWSVSISDSSSVMVAMSLDGDGQEQIAHRSKSSVVHCVQCPGLASLLWALTAASLQAWPVLS